MLPRLRDAAAQSHDVLQLMSAVPQLVNILRYGSTRTTEQEFVRDLLDEILPRIFVALPPACLHLEENPAREIFALNLQLHSSLGLLGAETHGQDWLDCLDKIVAAALAHPLLQGLAARLLFDRGYYQMEIMEQQLYQAVSRANEPAEKALWLEGFLYGNALLIVYHPPLWQVIDDWVKQLGEKDFFEILPILRRTFAQFSSTERQQLLSLARGEQVGAEAGKETDLDPGRVETLLPGLEEWLGG
jgi:hypothetical protein